MSLLNWQLLTLSRRRLYQFCTAIMVNSYFFSFFKCFPFPVLNCYSCPLAIFACPIGTIQFFATTGSIPYFTLGVVGLTGVIVGRMTCGWLCPFGLLQDLMFKIVPKEITIGRKWGYLRYAFLGLGVIILPLFWVNEFGLGERYFCEICPAGTLEAGIPHLLLDPSLQKLLGGFFIFKMSLLLIVVGMVLLIRRAFCRLFCPLGAMLGVFNRFSGLQIKVDNHKCNHCGVCQKKCPVDLPIYSAEGSPACINCLECTTCNHVSYQFKPL